MRVGALDVAVTWKRVKYLRLKVVPPSGDVQVSAPLRTGEGTIGEFVASKMAWILDAQGEVQARDSLPVFAFETGEEHLLWGEAYPLRVTMMEGRGSVALQEGEIVMCVSPGCSVEQRGTLLDDWYSEQLRVAMGPWLERWGLRMDVAPKHVTIRRMQTRWGSCTPDREAIRLNLELARVPRECAEYVVVHELVHLLELSHNARFRALMSAFMPDWRVWRESLRRFGALLQDG